MNRENGHAHLIYCLETSIRIAPDGRIKPLKYAAAVERALRHDLLPVDSYRLLLAISVPRSKLTFSSVSLSALCQEWKLLNQSMLINGEQVRQNSVCYNIILSMVLVLAFNLKGLLPWAIPVSGPAFTTPRGVVMLIGVICFAVFLDAAPSHPEFVGWVHIALNVGNKPEMDRMAELARLTGTLLSPPHMTGDGFYEAVIADLDPN